MTFKNVAAIAAIGISGVASAQVGGGDQSSSNLFNFSGVSVKVSVGIPFDQNLRDRVGNTLFGVGFEYQPTRSLLPNSETYYAASIFLQDYSGSEGFVLPITINQRFYNTRELGTTLRRQYAFVGVGFSIVDETDQTNAAFTLRGGVGAELGERIFFELEANFGERRGTIRPNVFALTAGYRF